MLNITAWLDTFRQQLDETFPDRIWFVGLQGSYARGEATDSSDIDVVVILDRLTPADVAVYGEMLDTLPERERICGFFSGKQELLSWAPSELFQFCFDTTPICGSLDCLLVGIDETAVRSAIKIGAGNVYHGCVHNMLHEKNEDVLRDLYKAAAFTVQAVYYLQTGRHIRRQEDLLGELSGEEQEILSTALALKRGVTVHFCAMSDRLVCWAQKWIIRS